MEAFEIAMEYDKSERKAYLEAAHRLRMPYWDWISEEAASQGDILCLKTPSTVSFVLSFCLSAGRGITWTITILRAEYAFGGEQKS